MHNILVVTETKSYIVLSIEEQLKKLDYKITQVRADIDEISAVKEPMDAIILYIDDELEGNQSSLIFLRDKAIEEGIYEFLKQ